MAPYGFSFSQCLRHAFFSGAGYGPDKQISNDDQARWVEYEPPTTGSFESMAKLFAEVEQMREALLSAAKTCDDWAEESRTGGWSTHQVKANRALADELRRVAQ